MPSIWHYHDHSANIAPEHAAFSSFGDTRRSLTPLLLPPDWLEPSSYYLSADFGDDIDFQSNHLDLAYTRPPSELTSLSGLGIRNLDLPMDLASLDNPYSEAAGIFDERMHPGGACELDFEITSRNRSDNKIGSFFDITMQDPSGSISVSDSPWSVSKALELAAIDSTTDLDSSFSAETNPLVAQMPSRPHAGDITHCFKEISAAAGLSLADFAAQISATADVALRNLATDGITPLDSSEGNVYDPFQTNINEITPKWFASDFVLPFENSVFRNAPPSWNNSCDGVNPADILPVQQSIEISVSPPAQLLGLPVLPDDDTAYNGNIHLPSSILQRDPNLEDFSFFPGSCQESRQLSDDEHSVFQSPSSSEYSPSLPGSGQKKGMPSKNSKRRITRSRLHSGLPLIQSRETPNLCDDENALLPINLGTPVFDAHRGVDIEVLKAKAERYRLRNQGREYDKRWLISFAGKLSPKGELMEEFRCYVTGCKQTNKRRDHILIHVGAHLDQRPFKCMYCASRFLRKNECKRHELSHTGIRPFSCHLCPYPSTTFVRQDLLKRHMKRTHRMQLKSDKENETPDRPKKRTRC